MNHTKHHLCVKYRETGEICTNRCPERQTCKNSKVPFLIEACDRLATGVHSGEIKGIPVIIFDTYCISPEAYINGVINVE